MCEAVLFDYLGQLRKSFFSNPLAKLPVLASFDRIKFVPWGKHDLKQNTLPVGGTVLREDLLNGKYDSFSPKAVKLPIIKFLEKDCKGKHHWFDVVRGLFMQGVLLNYCDELSVYIVTIRPIMPDASYNSWPRLLYNPNLETTNNISH